MLVLTRKPGDKVLIGDSINVTVAAVKGDRVRLGFEAPKNVLILRAELANQQELRPPKFGPETSEDHRPADPELPEVDPIVWTKNGPFSYTFASLPDRQLFDLLLSVAHVLPVSPVSPGETEVGSAGEQPTKG